MMTDQNFHGGVGQVAGGHIYNYGIRDIGDMTREELSAHLSNIQERLKDARRRVWFNPYTAWMAIGAVTFFTMIFAGIMFTNPTLFAFVILGGGVVPSLFARAIGRKYGEMIYHYLQEISRIQILQHARSWA